MQSLIASCSGFTGTEYFLREDSEESQVCPVPSITTSGFLLLDARSIARATLPDDGDNGKETRHLSGRGNYGIGTFIVALPVRRLLPRTLHEPVDD